MLPKLLVIISCCGPVFCLNPSIIIIGSGPSGIAAATRLWKANFTNLRILEAEPRIGGRVNSVKFGDGYVDLGGEWCHGEKDNIVYEMVKEYHVLKHRNISYKLVYSNGSYLDATVFEELLNFFDLVDASAVGPQERICKNFTSVGNCFDKQFSAIFRRKFGDNSEKLNVSLEATDWLKSYMLGFDSPSSLYDLYVKSDYKKCEGDLFLSWDGRGYKTILEVMMQKFPDPSKQLPLDADILLNKEVDKITWKNSDKGRVSVRCSDNSSFEADHVIFTPSLGVLKATYEQMFEPSLPEEKVKTIRSTGFGAILKLILHFPETWWNPQEALALVWSTEDKNKIATEFGKGPVKNGSSWLTTLAAIEIAENNPKVLIIFFAGSMIPEIERENNEVLMEGLIYTFRKFFGHRYSVIAPDQMMKTTWYSNPHFHGTFSYDSIDGNSVEHKFPDKLAAPLTAGNGTPVVQFAGEATHPHYFSTVHGAIETGYREADRLINLYANK
ncbi:hypothetical protein NQ318_017004 [Aromia moschata]|uniref:Amine oxidase domain-containing protein n=1 Tax=Aromia moschata TaxID=1265417 RepID=A0AAV8YFA0_9CUCU|nr:hypothetical protein NQ318_017004 [Aromia moschata]